MNFQQRSYQKELLDKDDIPFAGIRKNMEELEFINSWLGGHRITLTGLEKLLAQRKQASICEIGCGGGDNLAAIIEWCQVNDIRIKCHGIDIKKECIDFASARWDNKNISWTISDYRQVNFIEKPDIIFSSLFCHHFTREELVDQVKWMQKNSCLGFFINDLHRHPIAYYSIRWLTRLFSSSYLVKNDAPLSVARGFRRRDWKTILDMAGINNAQINWEWAFRYLVIYHHDSSAAI